jgi:hypothetical protein
MDVERRDLLKRLIQTVLAVLAIWHGVVIDYLFPKVTDVAVGDTLTFEDHLEVTLNRGGGPA